MPYRYFMKLAYNGTEFCGWQIQPNATTVQAILEKGLSFIIGKRVNVIGCGRTDTGVHARTFFAHFDLEKPVGDPDKLVFRLNRFLPPAISVQAAIPVYPGAHARFSAMWREYHYHVMIRKDPFAINQSYYFSFPIDQALMNQAAELLLDCSDFECFSKVKTQVSSFMCKIIEASWQTEGNELIFKIRSDRFLRNMVRAIVGTMLEVGRKKIDLDDFRKILQSRDRRQAGQSVPAKGLFLWDIQYPEGLFSSAPVWFSEDCPEKIVAHDEGDRKFHNSTGNEAYE